MMKRCINTLTSKFAASVSPFLSTSDEDGEQASLSTAKAAFGAVLATVLTSAACGARGAAVFPSNSCHLMPMHIHRSNVSA